MSTESTAPQPKRQAYLKLEDQKLLDIDFSGGLLSTFGGLPAAVKAAQKSGLIEKFVEVIPEWRKRPDLITFSIGELLEQRNCLVMTGNPGAIDCSMTKDDPALKSVLRQEPDGPPLASQSTHTRMEQAMTDEALDAMEGVFLQFFFEQHKHAPRKLGINIDSSAIRTYGSQQNSNFRGGDKYNQTQFFPIQANADDGSLLLAKLRDGCVSDAKMIEPIQHLVLDIKKHWPATGLTLRMDTGFNSPILLDFLDEEGVDYECGYPATSSVKSKVLDVTKEVEEEFRRDYGEPRYIGKGKSDRWNEDHQRIQALPAEQRMKEIEAMNARRVRRIVEEMHDGQGWDKERRLIIRVDYSDDGLDVRCVVTSKEHGLPESIYEDDYCTKRTMVETNIKENKSHSKVPLSCMEFNANRFRYILQGIAYQNLHLLRQQLPPSKRHISIATLRRDYLLIPVLIVSTPRRIRWRLSSTYRYQSNFVQIIEKLKRAA